MILIEIILEFNKEVQMISYKASQLCGASLHGATASTFVLLEWHWHAVHNPFMIPGKFIVLGYSPYEQRYALYLKNDTSTIELVVKISHDALYDKCFDAFNTKTIAANKFELM